jgi:hypothetical protein
MLYKFKNNTNGDLNLPKKNEKGYIKLKPNETFIGDEEYFYYIKPPLNLISLVEEIKVEEIKVEEIKVKKIKQNINKNKKEKKMKEKLILEQPEKEANDKNEEILLTEQPIGDMEVIQEQNEEEIDPHSH